MNLNIDHHVDERNLKIECQRLQTRMLLCFSMMTWVS